MDDLPADALRELTLRYDGPIPRQYVEGARVQRRRRRGAIAVLESQALAFLDAAARGQLEAEELASDLADEDVARWQRQRWEHRLTTHRERLSAQLTAAADALTEAASLRRDLGLDPHPLIGLVGLVTGPGGLHATR